MVLGASFFRFFKEEEGAIRLALFDEAFNKMDDTRIGTALRKGGWQRIFPEIERDPRIKDDFVSAAEDLEKKGVLSIRWSRHRRGDRIEALLSATALIRRVDHSGIELYYFGDLDPDGLLIFQEAEKLLTGPLRPWHMDADTYLRYVEYGYPLSEGSLARLAQLRPGRFDELAGLIGSHGRGVEQEVIDAAG